MTRRPAVVAAVLLALIGPLSACNRQSPRVREDVTSAPPATAVKGTDGVQTVVIDSNDGFKFLPTEILAAPGTLRIVLHNAGRTPHNLLLPALHKGTTDASGGQSVSVTVTVKAGTYAFLCSYHRDLGMTGQLIVQ